MFSDLCANKYVLAEYRVSIYGRDLGEWDKLAEWVVDNSLSCENVCYHIQVPRLFNVYHARRPFDALLSLGGWKNHNY